MKLISRLTLFVGLFALILSGCIKEKSVDTGASPDGRTQWEFKEAAVLFKGAVDTGYLVSTTGQQTLVVEGTSQDGSGALLLEITGTTITTGVYKIPNASFQYTVAGNSYYETDDADTDKFSVTITSINASEVAGTFSGEVRDILGNVKNITDGKFAARLKPSNPGANGQLQLWSKQACSGGGNILVKLGNQSGTITTYHATEPGCGATGALNYNLSPGVYTWKAFCGTDSVEGVAMVTPGNCTNVEVVFGGSSSSAVCRLTNIAFYNPLNNAPEGSITSFMNAAFKVTKLQIYDSVQGSLDAEFNLTYATNRVNVDAQQYFDLGPGERITEFHGYLDPMDNTSPKGTFKYQYDANGYMNQCIFYLDAFPTVPVLQINYIWTSGNLAKVEILEAGSAAKTVIEYQYDLTKQAKGFLCFFPNAELIIFQTAVNFGKNSANIAVKSTIKDYDAGGAVINTEVADFANHLFDAKGYVSSFVITGDASVYDTDVKYVLSYKCQ
jgi:hypothetical protein